MAAVLSREPGRADLVLAFVVVAVAVTLVEVLGRGGAVLAALTAIGGAAALGLLFGLGWHLAIRLAAGRGRRLVSIVCGVVVATWLAVRLGAIERLGTRNHGLAIAALLGSALAGGLVAIAIAWGSAREGTGARIHELPSRTRTLVAFALTIGAVISTWLDRSIFPGFHPAAHSALRAAYLGGLAFAVYVRQPGFLRAPLDSIALVVAVVFASMPFATLPIAEGPALQPAWATPLAAEGLDALRRLTDYDGDGHSQFLGGGDCEPLDPQVHPGATEIPGNAIDDDCAGGDATATTVDPEAVPVAAAPSPRSILLVTVETLRADHLGLYGYGRDTSPELDRWSEDARVYEHAFTPGAWTSIAIPSLLRGVNARRLPWKPVAETNRGRLFAPGEAIDLQPGERGVQTFLLPAGGVPPLPWWLRRRGMTTAAVVDDRFSELLDPSLGTAEGFDVFVDADEIRGRDPDDRVVDLAIDTLDSLPSDRPFFLWVHLFGPHSPNTSHEGVPEFGEGLADGYDHEIRFVDAQIGRLLQHATARAPELAWIVTADHGEVLLETDRMHGFDLSVPVIRVPLVLGGTDLPAGREPGLVSTLDLFPTIMALTESPAPDWLDGLDLTRGAPPVDRLVLVDTWHRDFDGGVLFDRVGITDGRLELVYERTKSSWGLVDLDAPERTPEEIARSFDPSPWTTRVGEYLAAPALELVDR